jgi:hypothetical protein
MHKHITVGLCETSKRSGQTLARNLQDLLKRYGLTKKILVLVKYEGANLNTMVVTLKSRVNCEALGMMENFQGICFGHAFFKACQYAIVEELVYTGLKYVSIKFA